MQKRGCAFNGDCLARGASLTVGDDPFFCSEQDEWTPKRYVGAICTSDSQCRLGLCSQGRCARPAETQQTIPQIEPVEPEPPSWWQRVLASLSRG